MRVFFLVAALILVSAPALARQRAHRAPASTPSIMVEEPSAKQIRQQRSSVRAKTTRQRRLVTRRALPSASTGTVTTIPGNTIGSQLQQLQSSQQNQFEVNQMRQDIQRAPIGIGGCPAGSIGC